MAKGRLVAGSCLVVGILAIVGAIVINVLLNDTATNAVQDASVTKSFAEADKEDYSKWIGETVDADAPVLYYNYYLFHNENTESILPQVSSIGPFTYAARKHKYDVVFSDDGALVSFKERTTITFDAEKSGTVPEGVNMYKIKLNDVGCPDGQTWLPPQHPLSAVEVHAAGDKLSEFTLISSIYTTALGVFQPMYSAGVSEQFGVAMQFGPLLAVGTSQNLFSAIVADVTSGAGHSLVSHVSLAPPVDPTLQIASLMLNANSTVIATLSGGFPGFTYPNFASYVADKTGGALPDPKLVGFTPAFLQAALFSPVFGLASSVKVDAAQYIIDANVHPGLQSTVAATDGQPIFAAFARLGQMYGTAAQAIAPQEMQGHWGLQWATLFGGGNAANCQDMAAPFNPGKPCMWALFAGWITDPAGPYTGFEASIGMDVGLTNFLSRGQANVTIANVGTNKPRIWTTRPAKDFLRVNNDKKDFIAKHGKAKCGTMTSSVDTVRNAARPSANGKLPSMAYQDNQLLEDDPLHGEPPKYTIYTGKKKLSLLNDITKYQDLTTLASRKSAKANGIEEWWYCNDEIPVEGRYLKQWPPGEAGTLGFKDGVAGDADFSPVVFSDAIWRPVRFLPNGDKPKYHGISTRRFTLDPAQLDIDLKYDQYVKGIGNFTCFSSVGASYDSLGLPVAVSRPFFEDSDAQGKLYFPNTIKGLATIGTLNAEKHETYIDIEPRTGAVFSVRERLQSNLIFPVPGLTSLGGLIVPLYYLERAVDVTEPLAAKFKKDFEDKIALKDSIWSGVGIAGIGLVLVSSAAFLVFCLRGRQTKATTVNW